MPVAVSLQFKPPQIIFIALLLKFVIHTCHCSDTQLHQTSFSNTHLFLPFTFSPSSLLATASPHIPHSPSLSLFLSPCPCLVNQTTSGDRSCRFPTSQWGTNIHPKEQHITVTPDDIMTTWKLINSFIQPKLLLLFISVMVPHLSLYLSFLSLSYLSQIHPPAPHLVAGAGVAH